MSSFSAHSDRGALLATEERRAYLERQSYISRFGTTTLALNNVGANHLLSSCPPGQILEANLDANRGITIRLSIESLEEEREFLQKELVNQWFLLNYINFESFFSRLCGRVIRERAPSADLHQEVVDLLMGKTWEGKFSKVHQELEVELGKRKTQSWLKSKDINFVLPSGVAIDSADKVLDAYRDKRNSIVHNNAEDKNGTKIQANINTVTDMTTFLIGFSDLVDRAFVKRYKWKRTPVGVTSNDK